MLDPDFAKKFEASAIALTNAEWWYQKALDAVDLAQTTAGQRGHDVGKLRETHQALLTEALNSARIHTNKYAAKR